MQAIVDVNRTDVIQDHHETCPPGCDLKRVPCAAGIDDAGWLCQVDDGAGPVGLVRPLIVDIDLVCIVLVDLHRILTPNKDAAVGRVIGPELHFDFEVRVRLLADEEAVAAARLHNAVAQFPVRIPHSVPCIQVRAIEQHRPSVLSLRCSWKWEVSGAAREGKQYTRDYSQRSFQGDLRWGMFDDLSPDLSTTTGHKLLQDYLFVNLM